MTQLHVVLQINIKYMHLPEQEDILLTFVSEVGTFLRRSRSVSRRVIFLHGIEQYVNARFYSLFDEN